MRRTKVNVPIHGFGETGQKIQVNFPQRCVYCGGPTETQVMVVVTGGTQAHRRIASYSTKLPLPYCLAHSVVNQQYNRLMMIIGLPIFLVVLFLPLTFPWIWNLLIGVGAITLLHGVLLLVFPRFREIPFGSAGALGVTIKLNATIYAATNLEFKFSNGEYATEFAQLNETRLATA